MRHDSQHPSVGRLNGGDSFGRSVGVERVSFRGSSGVVDVSKRNDGLRDRRRRSEDSLSLSVSESDREDRSVHGVEEDGSGGGFDLDERDSTLEDFGRVPLERGPSFRSGDDLSKLSEELASVADSESEGVLPGEEVGELRTSSVVEEDRLRPSVSGSENVSVRESSTGSDTSEGVESDGSTNNVRHVNVDGLESSGGEGESHLDVSVDSLLSKDGDLGFGGLRSLRERRGARGSVDERKEGSGDVVGESSFVGSEEDVVELLLSSERIVSRLLHLKRGLGPHLLDSSSARRVNVLSVVDDGDGLILGRVDLSDDVDVSMRETSLVEDFGELEEFLLRDLEDGSELLVEESGDGEIRGGSKVELVEVDLGSDSSSEAHLGDGSEET